MTRKTDMAAWDSAEVPDTPEAIEEYLTAAFETDDPVFIARALGTVARARNVSQLAREIGMTRAALYRAFNGETGPEFATIMKIAHALGVGFQPVVRTLGNTA